jgi:ATP/maltotriose-dependent transcriptional regulator MalT
MRHPSGVSEERDSGAVLLEREEQLELIGAVLGRAGRGEGGGLLVLAGALVDLGAALRRAGRRTDAHAPLRDGLDLAAECGAEPLRQRAADELEILGARPRKVVRRGADALTPSERRVAQMAVSGMQNREIAQALFVTVKTVETQLSSA